MKFIAYHNEPHNNDNNNYNNYNNNYNNEYFQEQNNKVYHLHKLIDAKRNMLLEKQQNFKKITKQNQFLEGIKKDYNKYYTYVKQQKQDQLAALDMLNKYMVDLSTSGELSKKNIADSKEEQKKILREMKHIKNSLDSILDDADSLTSNIRQ